MKSLLSILLVLFVILSNSQEKYRNFYTSVNASNEKDWLNNLPIRSTYQTVVNTIQVHEEEGLDRQPQKRLEVDKETKR